MKRPVLDANFDPSRASDRAADPESWRYPDPVREAVVRVIAERRDIRRFRPDPVPDAVLTRMLEAAHKAPSVGLSQPWRFIIVRSETTRARVRAIAERERMRQAPKFDERARAFLDQKVEGILEAPVGICVCCVPPPAGKEVLGRGTIPETDIYSTACGIQNLWLTARSEGLGVGWVSFYRPPDLREILGIPHEVEAVAWLCVGWPDERPIRPNLERGGWAARAPVSEVVMHESWSAPEAPAASGALPDHAARTAVRDRADQLVKPIGSLGALEDVVERWAAATGAPPPAPLKAVHLICAADHGHTTHGTSLFSSAVSSQVAQAAARGETAIGVLAKARGEHLVVADVGLRGPTPEGCLDRSIAPGSADTTSGPAMSAQQSEAAIECGRALTREALESSGADCVVVGEIGIGNTTTASALLCALSGAEPERVVGRGTGLDAAGVKRKREVVSAIVDRHRRWCAEQSHDPEDPQVVLASVGGLEFAALVGVMLQAPSQRVPVLLDGFATGVAALIAVSMEPASREWMFAGHRSAEPAHGYVLSELGIEPLLDLRLRLGEGSGAALALGLIEQAGRLHREMSTFVEAAVDGPQSVASNPTPGDEDGKG